MIQSNKLLDHRIDLVLTCLFQFQIVAVLKKKDRVVIELSGLNDNQRRKIGMRTVKPSAQNPNGGLVNRSVSTHISNVNPLRDESAE